MLLVSLSKARVVNMSYSYLFKYIIIGDTGKQRELENKDKEDEDAVLHLTVVSFSLVFLSLFQLLTRCGKVVFAASVYR